MNWDVRNKLNILRFFKKWIAAVTGRYFQFCSHSWTHMLAVWTRMYTIQARLSEPHDSTIVVLSHAGVMLTHETHSGTPCLLSGEPGQKAILRCFASTAFNRWSHSFLSGFGCRIVGIMVLFPYCQCARFTVFLFEIRGGSPESAGSDLRIELHMVMSSIARSMLAELAYIVLLVENWFLAWFTWKQAGITFRSRMLACICCCLCRDSICIQLLCLERQTSSVSYAVPVCMQWNHLISYNPMSWFCAVLENTSMYNMSNCHNLT